MKKLQTYNLQHINKVHLLICCFFLISSSIFAITASSSFNVRDYGAKGDGKTLDYLAINNAIDACVADGGGTVLLPAGTYLCGSIHLQSNIELKIDAEIGRAHV